MTDSLGSIIKPALFGNRRKQCRMHISRIVSSQVPSMKPRIGRSNLKILRTRTCALVAAGIVSLSERTPADEPRILTTVVQPAGNRIVKMAPSCDCSPTIVQEGKAGEQKSFWRWLPFVKRTPPELPVVPVAVSAPITLSIPTAKAPPTSALQPVSTPANLPPATTIPSVADRAFPSEKAVSQPLVLTPQDNNVSLKERRSDLRQMGLQDPTLKMFTSEIGAGPPAPAAVPQSESPGVLRRLFGRP